MRLKTFLLILSTMGIFIIIYSGLASSNLSSANESAEININPLEEDTFEILKKIKDKTYNKYSIGTVKVNHKNQIHSNEINIEIIGGQKYYDSVKDEVKELVKNTIKSTSFENYSINIIKSEINPLISEELKEEHLLILEIMKTIHSNLSESFPNQIDQISVDNSTPKLSIEVKTLLKEQKSTGIEKEINTILEKKLFSNKLVKEKPIEIHIYNKNEEEIN